MINVGKNFCPNYLWKILVTQETIWNIFYRFAPQKKNTIEIICLLGINLLLGYILEQVACEIDFQKTSLKLTELIISSNAIIV